MVSIFGKERQQFQYFAALTATLPKACGVVASYNALEVFTACNDDEANGIAIRFAHVRYPIEEGYGNHYVVAKKTEELTDNMVEANKSQSCYTRCLCGALLHCHKGTGTDTRKAKLETAVYNLQHEGYTKQEIMAAAEMYFPGEKGATR
jgi:hypothetical protein